MENNLFGPDFGGQIFENEPLKRFTTFKTGGNADVLVTACEPADIIKTVEYARDHKLTLTVLGNGSNVLVSDSGIRGITLVVRSSDEKVEINGKSVTAGAGVSLMKVSAECARAGLTGLEFASGVPGSLGGAVVMNAGAYGGEMKDVLREVTVLDTKELKVLTLKADALELGYRKSIIPKKGYIVLSAVLELEPGDQRLIKEKISELTAKRKEKQPLEYHSAGSTFKRPEGYFAGKLIEDAGLRGFAVGDACVSEKHCGFIVNKGNASSCEIYRLISEVQRRVYENSGVMLEPEVKMLGDFSDVLLK